MILRGVRNVQGAADLLLATPDIEVTGGEDADGGLAELAAHRIPTILCIGHVSHASQRAHSNLRATDVRAQTMQVRRTVRLECHTALVLKSRGP